MRKLLASLVVALLPCCLCAANLLDKVAAKLKKNGYEFTFSGTAQGSLQLQGDMFHLVNEQMESWFDGHTQWTLANDEINISEPAVDELLPSRITKLPQHGFKCTETGNTLRLEKEHTVITIYLDKNYLPVYIRFEEPNGHNEFKITKTTARRFDPSQFKLDVTKHPQCEIIDLR